MKKESLAPCPYCNPSTLHPNDVEFIDSIDGMWVECRSCNATGPITCDKKRSIELWNSLGYSEQNKTRIKLWQMLQENRELREKVKQYEKENKDQGYTKEWFLTGGDSSGSSSSLMTET